MTTTALSFNNDLFVKVANGTKTQTRGTLGTEGAAWHPLSACRFGQLGDIVTAKNTNTGETKHVIIKEIRIEALHAIHNDEIEKEGFSFRCDFANYWDRCYPSGVHAWAKNPQVFVITFELAKAPKPRCDSTSSHDARKDLAQAAQSFAAGALFDQWEAHWSELAGYFESLGAKCTTIQDETIIEVPADDFAKINKEIHKEMERLAAMALSKGWIGPVFGGPDPVADVCTCGHLEKDHTSQAFGHDGTCGVCRCLCKGFTPVEAATDPVDPFSTQDHIVLAIGHLQKVSHPMDITLKRCTEEITRGYTRQFLDNGPLDEYHSSRVRKNREVVKIVAEKMVAQVDFKPDPEE